MFALPDILGTDVKDIVSHVLQRLVLISLLISALNLAQNFKWARLNFTLHNSIQHSAELIYLNGKRGLGDLSEECLEANNNDIRKFLEDYSRKTDPVLQLTDACNRTLERSHPTTREIIAKFRPTKLC